MEIAARSIAPATVVPARLTIGADGQDAASDATAQVRPLIPVPRPGQSDEPVAADALAAVDPLRPTAADGWSPDRIVAVRSRHDGGFLGSAVNFTLGGVDERPGQRLSIAQVDTFAPFYAQQFGLDENYVRQELAKVYVYVGGPSLGGQAMTIGHHIFVPDERALERIMKPGGRRWLAHELVHTMQFLSYNGGSPQRFLADYISGMVVGRDPKAPGSGTGPAVWGALFTGVRTAGREESEIGKGSSSLRDTLVSTVLPATAVSVPLAMVASGGISAARATTGRNVLGSGRALPMAMGMIAAPAIAGSVLGAYDEQLGGSSRVLGTVVGGLLAAGALATGKAFSVGGSRAATELGFKLGRGTAIGLAVAGTIAGAGIGLLSSTASVNTNQGWSRTADLLHSLQHRPEGEAPEKLDFQAAMHDSHWQEIDAEAIARNFVRGDWERPKPGDPPIEGRIPTEPTGLGRVDQDVSDRVDWGLRVPLVIGVPAAIGLGVGVLGARTGSTVLRTTIKEGRGPMAAISAALELLGSSRRGVRNSMGVGAALTVAPLVAGGLVGPFAFNATGDDQLARMAGAGAGAVVTGTLLTRLLKGRGSGMIATSGKVLAGMGVAAALGMAAGGVATDALNPRQREYDIAGWTRAAAANP